MALNIKVDLENCYAINTLSKDQKLRSFETVLKTGERMILGINISDKMHPIIPNVYNLSFGPLDDASLIDDKAKLDHQDHSKVFSTIILSGLTFLKSNPSEYLGIDGSCNARAYLYYRCICNNLAYLSRFFRIYGIKYYVRILRDFGQEMAFDWDDITADPCVIKEDNRLPYEKLYNYFIFNARD
ncbi:DUF6934 family protein [Chitinophaga cymbidii]|uniref:Uncharacterized protein n=1 Tax=Chitinophaga cymbidii TaxID=1096750 RepID=A0A512RES8_9BACT|nr:hypothetical protein [Chitinophaga cymbidii]GEP94201.1 hypothetical protein CCY01nite_04610 [Chitinophaga cymbidii]